MQRSTDRILTTHAGSLPRQDDLLELLWAREDGGADAAEKFRDRLPSAVAEIVVRLAPERTLSVEGHTDSVGTEEYNLDLSLRRAQTVMAELAAGGVMKEKIRSVGHGERFPVAPNQTASGRDDPQGRAQNRRVEVIIERES